ncbi:MAG TPA: hypothetical protein VHA57_02600 [Actinomycetota bacterium]|nr:hypothetical protein [Actinomycetota bacterium]
MFHVWGVVVAALAIIAGWFLLVVLTAFTASCAPDPGSPVALHVGTAVIGAAVASIPAVWGRWARRRTQVGWPWWVAAGLCGAATVAIDASIRISGCLFTF